MEWHTPWDVRVTLDLFLGGLGVGMFLLSVMLHIYDENRYSRLSKIAAFLAPVLVGGGILFLLSELGRPERFISTMYNFNPQSLTSWGSVFQALFILILLGYVWLHFKGNTFGKVFKITQGAGIVLALLVGGYHGLLLSSLGRPLWAGGMITAIFLVSSFLVSTALLLIIKELGISLAVPKNISSEAAVTSETKGFNFTFLLFILSVVQFVFILAWQISINRGGLETVSAAGIMMERFGILWISLVVLGGSVLPLLGSLYSLIKDRKAEMSKKMTLILSSLAIIGGFALKHIILIAGQIKI